MLLLEDKIMKIANLLDEELYYDDAVIDEDSDWTPVVDIFYYSKEVDNFLHGITKIVAINDSCSKVLKIPFHASYKEEYDYEHDEYTGEFEYFHFHNADSSHSIKEENAEWDYCADELRKYEQAVKDGMEEFFPATEFYKVGRCGIPYYIQEKVMPFKVKDCNEEKEKNSYKKAKEISKSYRNRGEYIRVSDYFIAACLEWYGKEKTIDFLEYAYIKYPEIGRDLHENNLGRRVNGAPIVLDFSGFRESF